MERIDTEQAKIKYTDDDPKVEVFEERAIDNIRNKFFEATLCECNNKYTIHIPEGSIKTNYNLDAQ